MADYTDFPDEPQPGDIVDKNGRTWYYDSTKWVLFSDSNVLGDVDFDDVPPVKVDIESSTNDQGNTTRKVTTSLDMTTVAQAES